jgi:MoaA/NifB/PqqE/SkfB family radical SAM enzyme
MLARERAVPLQAHLELTYGCNWRCVFCYNPRHHDLRRLELREWDDVLDDLRELGTLTVTLTGGEPLTSPDFLPVARAVRERAMALRVFTNGSLIDEPMAAAIAELRPLAVELSLHGATAATHDRTTQRPGSFAAVWEAVARLRRVEAPTVLKTPLTSWNEAELDGIVELAAGAGVPLRLDATIVPRDDGDRAPLAWSASADGTRRLYRLLSSRGELAAEERRAGGSNCGLGTMTLAVDPEGNVYPCLQWRQSSLGNVRHAPLRRLWRQSAVRDSAARTAREANDSLVTLGGPAAEFAFCPALALLRSGDATRPDAIFEQQAAIAAEVRAAR